MNDIFEKPPLEDVYDLLIGSEKEDELEHYGMPRRSGRYPWGSGDSPYQHSGDFLARVKELRKEKFVFTDADGKTYSGDNAIARSMGLNSTQFRTAVALANSERRAVLVAKAKGLREKGYNNTEIAKQMGLPGESSVRSLFKESSEIKMNEAKNTAEFLKNQIKQKGVVDVGEGVDRELNISKQRLDQALALLEMEGYIVRNGRREQVTNPNQTTITKALFPPNTTDKEAFDIIYNHPEKLNSVKDYISRDDGVTYEKKFNYPSSLDSKRLMIRYSEDGGAEKDGVIELRRNVPDLDLKDRHYAQVRILVDNDRYLKGMAVYSDDMPDGVDVIFNTNKGKSTPKMDVLKKIKSDPDNPFGSSIKDAEKGGQYFYTDKNGKKKLGLLNKCREEGDWSEWSDKVPSQFLSKQNKSLAKKQLDLAIKDRTDEFKDIMDLTNPTVKKRLLQDFADGCDSQAVHLYAASFPRQKHHVILPITSMKDNEVFAPGYENGETLALIRYPHGGTFEIPIVKVNNRNKEAINVIGSDSLGDAIGINSHVAARLSGADFDGDTVMVIPTNSKVKIKSTKPLQGLEGFDPKMEYGTREEKNPNYTGKKGEEEFFYYNKYGNRIKVLGENAKQQEMGKVSNLITDMTIRGATTDELARAVRHSMVVIDATKHHLDYKQSYLDNNIKALEDAYKEHGASTIISKAKSQTSIPRTQGSPKINVKYKNPETGQLNPDYDPTKPEGSLIYKTSEPKNLYYPVRTINSKTGIVTLRTTDGKRISYNPKNESEKTKYAPILNVDEKTGKISFTNKDGTLSYKYDYRKQKSTKMAETDDARTLMSKMKTPMEQLYADYANTLKALANTARKEMVYAGKIEYDSRANKIYAREVASLDSQLKEAIKNKPRERQANNIASSRIEAKKKSNPDMTKDEEKKLRQQELSRARELVGAKRYEIKISDKEWEAIQAGAIHENMLKEILEHADLDVLRERATPRNSKSLSTNQINRINSMRNSGLTISQIANALGVSTSTVSNYIKDKNN